MTMKKLLSLASILAMVIGTWAFAPTIDETFCVRNEDGNACELLHDAQEDPNGEINHYWPEYINEILTPCAQADPATQCDKFILLSEN